MAAFLDRLAQATLTNGAAPRPLFADYFTADQLAQELGITERHLYERHKVGLAPPRTVVGRTILYRRDAVLEWLRSLEEGYQPPANGDAAMPDAPVTPARRRPVRAASRSRTIAQRPRPPP